MAFARWLAVTSLVVAFLNHGVRTANAADFCQDVVDLTNIERIKQGLAPLVVSGSLSASAQGYASMMATDGFLGHDGPDGSTVQQRDEAAGYTGWDFLAENVATGQTSAAEVVAAWLASPGHRANLLSPREHELGVGHAVPTGSSAASYWVEEFGDRPGVSPALSTAIPALAVATTAAWTSPNGRQVGGPWLTFARSHGDVDVLGLPRTDVTNDARSGQSIQYFQRTLLEWHPENQSGRQIERRLLGDIVYPGADPPVNPNDPPTASAEYFPFSSNAPTGLGHFVANATRTGQPTYFRDFFDSHGGVDIFGYPKEEPKLRNGRWTQRFQAAVFEYHPENDRDGYLPGTQIPFRDYRVQLELLGDEYMKALGIPLK